MRDTPLEKSVIVSIKLALAREPQCWFFKTWGSAARLGLPDLIGCHRGQFFAFEVKRPGGKPTAMQAHILDMIQRAGGLATVVHSREEALCALRVGTEALLVAHGG